MTENTILCQHIFYFYKKAILINNVLHCASSLYTRELKVILLYHPFPKPHYSQLLIIPNPIFISSLYTLDNFRR